ncbi:hypothetical protein BDV95DRAFT_603866 [Massariosphaeria phaeospora]|uniref:Uncharacterized protein n=1 Tax=Massariosphaeria phaeospora TaxID=100035 RepID=A0A7C8MA51_9PLEO|nr:hypothetical protein BDV95DRAFT_603866 [Massariosphaeria phaeospora]
MSNNSDLITVQESVTKIYECQARLYDAMDRFVAFTAQAQLRLFLQSKMNSEMTGQPAQEVQIFDATEQLTEIMGGSPRILSTISICGYDNHKNHEMWLAQQNNEVLKEVLVWLNEDEAGLHEWVDLKAMAQNKSVVDEYFFDERYRDEAGLREWAGLETVAQKKSFFDEFVRAAPARHESISLELEKAEEGLEEAENAHLQAVEVEWTLSEPRRAAAQAESKAKAGAEALALVESFEQVDIATIPAEDMRCPICLLDFGNVDEELPATDGAATEPNDEVSNNPVRTPCGHLFGKSCLVEIFETVKALCPICRTKLRPALEVAPTTVLPAAFEVAPTTALPPAVEVAQTTVLRADLGLSQTTLARPAHEETVDHDY